jgi:hypothetical protein
MAAKTTIVRGEVVYLVYDKSIQVQCNNNATMFFFAREVNSTTDIDALHSLIVMGEKLKSKQIRKVLEVD